MSTTDHFTYTDLPTAAPAAIADLMPGARNAMDYTDVQPGEHVLVLAENGTDPVVLQALVAAAAYRGAETAVLTVSPFSAGGWDRENPSPIVPAAHGAADVVISCTWWGEVHTSAVFFNEVAKKRARFLSLHQQLQHPPCPPAPGSLWTCTSSSNTSPPNASTTPRRSASPRELARTYGSASSIPPAHTPG